MGMDVMGKKATSEIGSYFRANVWYWHPLWDYCASVAKAVTDKVKYAHFNDGDGLGKRDSLKLAKVLRGELDTGRTKEYVETRDCELAKVPDIPCDTCGGVGKRADPPKTGPGKMVCNGCDGKGKIRPWETHYHLDVETVEEFVSFLEECGGFRIC